MNAAEALFRPTMSSTALVILRIASLFLDHKGELYNGPKKVQEDFGADMQVLTRHIQT